jgi:hypothetical protein
VPLQPPLLPLVKLPLPRSTLPLVLGPLPHDKRICTHQRHMHEKKTQAVALNAKKRANAVADNDSPIMIHR